MVEAAITAGKILAGQKDQYLALAKADLANTSAVLATMPGKPNLHGQLQPEAKGEAAGKETDPKAAWDFGKWRKEDPRGLEAMRKTDPKAYEALKEKYLRSRP